MLSARAVFKLGLMASLDEPLQQCAASPRGTSCWSLPTLSAPAQTFIRAPA